MDLLSSTSRNFRTRFYGTATRWMFFVLVFFSLSFFSLPVCGKLVFLPRLHEPRVYQGAPSGLYVMTVRAQHDHKLRDDSPHNQITYKLLKGSDVFQVNETSGRISTHRIVNRTIGESYALLVVAVSGGATESLQEQVQVIHYNRYTPQFKLPTYRLELPYTETLRKTLMTIEAVDADEDPFNSEIYYFLRPKGRTGGDVGPHARDTDGVVDSSTEDGDHLRRIVPEDSRHFFIDPRSGELMLVKSLEAKVGRMSFDVVAIDGGSPHRWNVTSVDVMVKSITFPLNITVDNIAETQARVCWSRPQLGALQGYVVRYRESWRDVTAYNGSATFLREDTLNITIQQPLKQHCTQLKNLHPNSKFELRIYGWNIEEIGLGSEIVMFSTKKPRCPSENICNNGTCHLLSDYDYSSSSSSSSSSSNILNYRCECRPGFYGSHCEHFDPCSTTPCHNLGTCVNVSSEKFECHCLTGFYGEDCSHFDPCASSGVVVCQNGGSCHSIDSHLYECICKPGYYGRGCEFFNPCKTTVPPCKNEATCSNISESEFICSCKLGFTGKFCEENIDECASSPCFNGGECQDAINSFSCECSPGFEGGFCQEEIDECLSSPCLNGGSCEDATNSFVCHCPLGYEGILCEIDIDECSSGPCLNGADCRDGPAAFTCSCAAGYEGIQCETPHTCPSEDLELIKGNLHYNATSHGVVVTSPCPYGPSGSLALRECVLLENGTVGWSLVDLTNCREQGYEIAEKLTGRLRLMTANPLTLNAAMLTTVTENIEKVLDYALKDAKIAEQMVNVISNVLNANETAFQTREKNSTSTRLSNILDRFINEVEPQDGNMTIKTSNLEISVTSMSKRDREEINQDPIRLTGVPSKLSWDMNSEPHEDGRLLNTIENINRSGHINNPTMNVSPKVMGLAAGSTELRLQFMAFSNAKIFKECSESAMDRYTPTDHPVLSVSIANMSVRNVEHAINFTMKKPLYGQWICVFWNDSGIGSWSTEGLTVEQTEDQVTCISDHMTAFSILFDPDPTPMDPFTQKSLSIISYIGSGLSVFGLSLTIITYSLFRCLNRDKSGKILLNLCVSMLLLNVAFLTGSLQSDNSFQLGTEFNICQIVAVLTHYFLLTTLSWMTVEAANMYQLLIHVFATSETRFMLKRCLVAWGIPMVIVCTTAAVNIQYYDNGNEYCMLSAVNPYVYYISFLGPCCLLLVTNVIVFMLVTRVLFQPRVTTRIQHKPSRFQVTFAQVRGAFTVMTLLGITWVFGAFAIGPARIVFQYIFCVLNSLQGFLVFVVRCLQYPEARSAWYLLLTTGTLKKTRGTKITTSTNSHVKLSLSSGADRKNSNPATNTTKDGSCIVANGSGTVSKPGANGETAVHGDSNGGGVNTTNFSPSWVYGGRVSSDNVVPELSTERSSFKKKPFQFANKIIDGFESFDMKEGRDTHWQYLNLNGQFARERQYWLPQVSPLQLSAAEENELPFIEDEDDDAEEQNTEEDAREKDDKVTDEDMNEMQTRKHVKSHRKPKNSSQSDQGYSSAEQSPSSKRLDGSGLSATGGAESLDSSTSNTAPMVQSRNRHRGNELRTKFNTNSNFPTTEEPIGEETQTATSPNNRRKSS